jgi:MT0933-like antitoxin protein
MTEWASQTDYGGGAMPDFSEMADKAKDVAGDHDKQSDEALDKASQFADDKTGNKYDSQINSGEDKAEGYLGVEDQDKQN